LDRCVKAPGVALLEPSSLAQGGRLLIERGEQERGEQVLQLLARGDSRDAVVYGAMHVLAEYLRRSARYDEALALWERMREVAGPHDLHPWIASSIALEHRLDRTLDALDVVDQILGLLSVNASFVTTEEFEGLQLRRQRLLRRAGSLR
jgi:hypothetical protein